MKVMTSMIDGVQWVCARGLVLLALPHHQLKRRITFIVVDVARLGAIHALITSSVNVVLTAALIARL